MENYSVNEEMATMVEPGATTVATPEADDTQNVAEEAAQEQAQEAPQGYIPKDQYEQRIRVITANASRDASVKARQEFMQSPEFRLAQGLSEMFPDATPEEVLERVRTQQAERLAQQLEDNPQEVIKQLLQTRSPQAPQPPQAPTPQMMFQRAVQEAQMIDPPNVWNELVDNPKFQQSILRGDSYEAAKAIATMTSQKPQPPPPTQTMRVAQPVALKNNISKLTDAEMEALIRRAESGERIIFETS